MGTQGYNPLLKNELSRLIMHYKTCLDIAYFSFIVKNIQTFCFSIFVKGLNWYITVIDNTSMSELNDLVAMANNILEV